MFEVTGLRKRAGRPSARDFPTFRLLGKHAAYTVSLTKSTSIGGTLFFKQTTNSRALHGGKWTIRQRDPELFYKLYPVAKDKRTAEDWFDACEGGLSHPYDPLLVLSAFQPKLFRRRGTLGGGGGFDMNSAASTGDKRQACGHRQPNRCPDVKDAMTHDAVRSHSGGFGGMC